MDMVDITDMSSGLVANVNDLPQNVMQHKIFSMFSSRELFLLRGVCGEWCDSIKVIWEIGFDLQTAPLKGRVPFNGAVC